MVPPVKRYRSSQRQYQSQPKRWDYGPGAEVRRLNSAGCLSEEGDGGLCARPWRSGTSLWNGCRARS